MRVASNDDGNTAHAEHSARAVLSIRASSECWERQQQHNNSERCTFQVVSVRCPRVFSCVVLVRRCRSCLPLSWSPTSSSSVRRTSSYVVVRRRRRGAVSVVCHSIVANHTSHRIRTCLPGFEHAVRQYLISVCACLSSVWIRFFATSLRGVGDLSTHTQIHLHILCGHRRATFPNIGYFVSDNVSESNARLKGIDCLLHAPLPISSSLSM